MTHSITDTLALLAAADIHPSKAFGQNFVVDPNTVRRIARLADVAPGERVLEIGAGLGALTMALMEAGAVVTAVEIDKRIVAVLRTVVEPSGATVIEGDAMRMDWDEVLGDQSWTVVANLPYNIASPLVIELLNGVPQIERMVIMVQDEAGKRMAAIPGDEAYGALSAKISYWAHVKVIGKVPQAVFYPRPKVESVLVSVTRRPPPDIAPQELFPLINRLLYNRRRMLRSMLTEVSPEEFAQCGLTGEERPWTLSQTSLVRLAGTEGWKRQAADEEALGRPLRKRGRDPWLHGASESDSELGIEPEPEPGVEPELRVEIANADR